MNNLSCQVLPKKQRSNEERAMLKTLVEITAENMIALKATASMIKETHNFTPDELRGIDVIVGAAEVRATDVYQIRSIN